MTGAESVAEGRTRRTSVLVTQRRVGRGGTHARDRWRRSARAEPATGKGTRAKGRLVRWAFGRSGQAGTVQRVACVHKALRLVRWAGRQTARQADVTSSVRGSQEAAASEDCRGQRVAAEVPSAELVHFGRSLSCGVRGGAFVCAEAERRSTKHKNNAKYFTTLVVLLQLQRRGTCPPLRTARGTTCALRPAVRPSARPSARPPACPPPSRSPRPSPRPLRPSLLTPPRPWTMPTTFPTTSPATSPANAQCLLLRRFVIDEYFSSLSVPA